MFSFLGNLVLYILFLTFFFSMCIPKETFYKSVCTLTSVQQMDKLLSIVYKCFIYILTSIKGKISALCGFTESS